MCRKLWLISVTGEMSLKRTAWNTGILTKSFQGHVKTLFLICRRNKYSNLPTNTLVHTAGASILCNTENQGLSRRQHFCKSQIRIMKLVLFLSEHAHTCPPQANCNFSLYIWKKNSMILIHWCIP